MPDDRSALLRTAFADTADSVARERPEVDAAAAREVFEEAATLLHDGLVLDWLDDHDAARVVAGLCADLVTEDPGAAVRARAAAVQDGPEDLHDPGAVSGAYLVAARILDL